MNIRLSIALGACLAVAAAGPALAQDPGPSPDLPVDTIEITIDPLPETGDIDPSPIISVPDEMGPETEGDHIMAPRFDDEGHEKLEHPGEVEHGSDIEVEPGEVEGDHGADLTPDVPDIPDSPPDTSGDTPETEDH